MLETELEQRQDEKQKYKSHRNRAILSYGLSIGLVAAGMISSWANTGFEKWEGYFGLKENLMLFAVFPTMLYGHFKTMMALTTRPYGGKLIRFNLGQLFDGGIESTRQEIQKLYPKTNELDALTNELKEAALDLPSRIVAVLGVKKEDRIIKPIYYSNYETDGGNLDFVLDSNNI